MTVLPNYTFTNLKPGHLGTFTVRAVSGSLKGASSPQIEFTTLNSGPNTLTSSLITSTGFTLNWAPVPGATSYNVYNSDSLVGTSATTSFAISKLIPGTTATYSVRAVFSGQETFKSEVLNVSTLVEKPAKPVVSQISATTASISWIADANAESYSVTLYDALGTSEIGRAHV